MSIVGTFSCNATFKNPPGRLFARGQSTLERGSSPEPGVPAAPLRQAAISTLFVLTFLISGCHRHRKTTSAPNGTTDYADNIRAVVAKPQLFILRWPNYADYQQAITTFYDDRNYELAWLRDLKPEAAATNRLHSGFPGCRSEGG